MPPPISKKKKVTAKPKANLAAGKTKSSKPKIPKTAPAGSLHARAVSDYVIGDRVAHPIFGDGLVTAIEVDKLTIKFTDGRVKQILDYYIKRQQR